MRAGRVRRGGVAALLLAAACGPRTAPVAPASAFVAASPGEFRSVAARTSPAATELLTIHWRFDDGQTPVSGRGAVRLAPPDSLRLDVGVPILGRATLVLAGDSVWAQPDRLVEQVMPNRALVWAMFGVVRPPDVVARVERSEAADHRLYRVTGGDGVVTTLELRGDTLLGATQARAERPIGRLDLTRDAAGMIVRAVTTDLEHSARFTVNVDHREVGGSFPNEIWRRP